MFEFLKLFPFLMAEPAAPPAEPPPEPAPIEGSPPPTPVVETPQPSDKTGLMGKAAAGEEEPAPGEPPKHPAEMPPEPAPPVEGERPEFVPEQFWDMEKKEVKLEELTKSYAEVRNENNKLLQVGGGKPLETPEEYIKDFVPPTRSRPGKDGAEGDPLDRFEEGLTAQDPAFLAAAKAAKNASLSKKQFDEFIYSFMEESNNFLPKPLNEEEELESLGPDGINMVKVNANWINSMKTHGVLNQDQYDLLLDFGKTALGVELTNALRTNSGEKPIPLGGSVNTGVKTPDECQAMLADERYHKDGAVGDAYRAEVDAEFAKTHGTGKS